jgi:uncharacterized membrane protein HdeD (DUF308 family)
MGMNGADIAGGDPFASLRRFWWVILLYGLASVGVGILMIVYPGKTLTVISVAFGIFLLFAGLFDLMRAIMVGTAEPSERVLAALLGVLALIAGTIVIRRPGESLFAIVLALGIYLLVRGSVLLVVAFGREENRGLFILSAVLDLLGGMIVIAYPGIGVVTLAVVVAVTLLLRGGLLVAESFALRKVPRPAS